LKQGKQLVTNGVVVKRGIGLHDGAWSFDRVDQ
jgi:hypothetical protein